MLHRDERIVVVDKPPFMATAPRGRHVVHSALARTRVLTGLAQLAPAHRLDRLTAGVLILTTEQRWRGAYQQAFAERVGAQGVPRRRPGARGPGAAARAAHPPVKEHGVHQAREVDGEAPNAETVVELLERRGALGLYRLTPRTGRTHQLRAQLSGLGLPILGDPLYPVDRNEDHGSATTTSCRSSCSPPPSSSTTPSTAPGAGSSPGAGSPPGPSRSERSEQATSWRQSSRSSRLHPSSPFRHLLAARDACPPPRVTGDRGGARSWEENSCVHHVLSEGASRGPQPPRWCSDSSPSWRRRRPRRPPPASCSSASTSRVRATTRPSRSSTARVRRSTCPPTTCRSTPTATRPPTRRRAHRHRHLG